MSELFTPYRLGPVILRNRTIRSAAFESMGRRFGPTQQLGNMTHYGTAGQIPIGASTGFNLYAYTPVRGMRRSEIAGVARDFGRAVHTAHEAGFDSVEVHAGHGYLISQFLSPYTNRRRDEYGGSLGNRMRFMRMCLEEVMEAAARTGTAVLVKHNMYDGFEGGIEIPESLETASCSRADS